MQIKTNDAALTGWLLLYAHSRETLFGYTQDASVLDRWLSKANCGRKKNHYQAESITDSRMISRISSLGDLEFNAHTVVDRGQLVDVLDV